MPLFFYFSASRVRHFVIFRYCNTRSRRSAHYELKNGTYCSSCAKRCLPESVSEYTCSFPYSILRFRTASPYTIPFPRSLFIHRLLCLKKIATQTILQSIGFFFCLCVCFESIQKNAVNGVGPTEIACQLKVSSNRFLLLLCFFTSPVVL